MKWVPIYVTLYAYSRIEYSFKIICRIAKLSVKEYTMSYAFHINYLFPATYFKPKLAVPFCSSKFALYLLHTVQK